MKQKSDGMTASHLARNALGITQVELARCLHISQQLVSDWETDRKKPSQRDKFALAWLVEHKDLFEHEKSSVNPSSPSG